MNSQRPYMASQPELHATKINLIIILSGLLIITGAFAASGCGESSSSSSGSSGNNGSTPITQTIWANGAFGAWQGDLATGAIAISYAGNETSQVISDTDNVSGHATSLELRTNGVDSSGTDTFYFDINNFKDVSAYNGGQLQFNIKLAAPVIATAISLGTPFSTPVNVSVGALNSSTFTHISTTLPSNMNGTTKRLLTIGVTYVSGSTSVQPLVILNDVKWTKN